MDYKVLITTDAEADLNRYISYLLFVKKSEQAAQNLLDDFEQTTATLAHVAGSLKDCENPELKQYGYKRIGFLKHRYFMLYRIDGNAAIVDNIFHELQDYENKLI
jgi:plasmid stabilization system protein ParE